MKQKSHQKNVFFFNHVFLNGFLKAKDFRALLFVFLEAKHLRLEVTWFSEGKFQKQHISHADMVM